MATTPSQFLAQHFGAFPSNAQVRAEVDRYSAVLSDPLRSRRADRHYIGCFETAAVAFLAKAA